MRPYQQTNGLGIAALITGIIALVLSIIPLIGIISWLLAPIAIILGIIGMNQNAPRGTAIGGLATGGLALIICILWAVLFGYAVSETARIQRESGRSGYESNR